MIAENLTPEEKHIQKLEQELLEKKKEIARLKHGLPEMAVRDYEFKSWDGKVTSLSDMFGVGDELLLIHNMGKSCPYCTLWADGINGQLQHLENRVPVVVISPDPPDIQKQFATGRGWRFAMHSCHESSFARDMGFQEESGAYWPGVSTYRKNTDGKIFRKARAVFGPGDDFCHVWHFLDLLPRGANGWEPKFTYAAG